MKDKAAEFASEWLEKARHDHLAAETLAAQMLPLTDTAAFHCQQAVEKSLKAFLTYHGIVFEKTHDVGRLCGICAQIDSSFAGMRERVIILSDYGVRFRYPGSADPTIDEVRSALAIVRDVWDFVLERLPPHLGQAFPKA